MGALIDVILPVFSVIGFGYLAAYSRLISNSAIDGIMQFAQSYAIPCLLFLAISKIDLAADVDIAILASYYIGAFASFGLGYLGAIMFGRDVKYAISIGFCAMFSNTTLLGLPITERAYGSDALVGNYAILSVHALLTYSFGSAMMEFFAADRGHKPGSLPVKIARTMAGNPLLIGVVLGLVANLTHAPLPKFLLDAVNAMSVAALPAALFALGGILVRYRPEGDSTMIALITGLSLAVHPTLTYVLGTVVFSLDQAALRSAVVTAAMAPGINTFLFASIYGVAMRVAATSVLFATALSILTVWFWLAVLP